jgi:CTP synthase (UTP-ammonia lyase)
MNKAPPEIQECHGILVPGGFGKRGVEEKILAIEYARKNNIPFFGICLGMQLAIIEFVQNVLKLENPNSLEFAKDCLPVFKSISAILKKENLANSFNTKGSLGGTMRLGHYACKLQKGSRVAKIYNKDLILERHRHRYEFNNDFLNKFIGNNLLFTACIFKRKFSRNSGAKKSSLVRRLSIPSRVSIYSSKATSVICIIYKSYYALQKRCLPFIINDY